MEYELINFILFQSGDAGWVGQVTQRPCIGVFILGLNEGKWHKSKITVSIETLVDTSFIPQSKSSDNHEKKGFGPAVIDLL